MVRARAMLGLGPGQCLGLGPRGNVWGLGPGQCWG